MRAFVYKHIGFVTIFDQLFLHFSCIGSAEIEGSRMIARAHQENRDRNYQIEQRRWQVRRKVLRGALGRYLEQCPGDGASTR
jgi:hypothetical protein